MRAIIPTILLLIIQPLTSFSQRLPLGFKSYAIKFEVTNDESFSLVSKAGELAIKSHIDSLWHRPSLTADGRSYGNTFEQSCFFNRDTGFISGFILGEGSGYDIIYQTTDAGRNWTRKKIGQSGWVDMAVRLNSGEAWLSVAGSGIAYTADYGQNWQKISIPSVKDRYTSIDFNSAREGLMGSLWNKLIYTKDNGKTWTPIPTPLDQSAYSKTNTAGRPEFKRVAMVGDLFLVIQEELVFYSKKDKIKWIPLPDLIEFYIDPSSRNLFFQQKFNKYFQSDSSLSRGQVFQLDTDPFDIVCRNNNLYFLIGSKIVKFSPGHPTAQFNIGNNKDSLLEIQTIGYMNDGTALGIFRKNLYQQKVYNGPWTLRASLSIDPDSGSLYVNNGMELIFVTRTDSIIKMDLFGKTLMKSNVGKLFEQFNADNVTSIQFVRGSQGCFHNFQNVLEYKLRGGAFEGAIEVQKSKDALFRFAESPDKIDPAEIKQFCRGIYELSKKSEVSIEDFQFNESDYNQLKRDILLFRESLNKKDKKSRKLTEFQYNVNNLNFDKLLRLVDSIPNLRSEVLVYMLSVLPGGFSTTTNWIGFKLINANNIELSVNHFDYGSFDFPFNWVIKYEGYSFMTTNIAINKLLSNIYPGFVEYGNKRKLLHHLVKKLYELS